MNENEDQDDNAQPRAEALDSSSEPPPFDPDATLIFSMMKSDIEGTGLTALKPLDEQVLKQYRAAVEDILKRFDDPSDSAQGTADDE